MLPAVLVCCLVTIVLLWLPSGVSSQDYTIPPGWRNTVSNASRADRINLAFRAATGIVNRINGSTGLPPDAYNDTTPTSPTNVMANMLVVLASQDWLTGIDTWKTQVVANTLPFYESGKDPNEGVNTSISNIDTGVFGLAEIAAYLAYNDTSRLSIAKRNFDLLYNDFLSDSAAQSGAYPRAMSTSCGPSLGGLLLAYTAITNNTLVHAGALGPWIALSAYLYEHTSNTTYRAAAEQSVRFMQTFMVNSSNPGDVISGELNPTDCSISYRGAANVDDIGPYIQGLSVLANVTSNNTYTQWLNDLVPAIVSYANWHTDDGILRQDTPFCSKGSLLRGLLEARLRNPANSGLVALIESYITVQYNAVRNNAYTTDNSYTISWRTDGNAVAQPYSTVGNVEALGVLNAAIGIAPANVSSPSTSAPQPTSTSPQPTSSPPHGHKVSVGVIAGSALGGLAAVAAFVLILIIRSRRRRRARETPVNEDQMDISNHPSQLPLLREGLIPEPFTLTTPVHNRLASTPEKGASQQRDAPLTTEHQDSNTRDPLLNSSMDAAGDTSLAQNRPAADEPNALHALERRLQTRFEHMIQALAIRGETESNPPEYDDHGSNRHTSRVYERPV